MKTIYSYDEFVNIIKNNPSIKFIDDLGRINKDSEHGCSFYTSVNGYSIIDFHNFELNSSYHIKLFEHIKDFNSEFSNEKKDAIKNIIEWNFGVILNDLVYENIQDGFNHFYSQLNSFISFIDGTFDSSCGFSCIIFFDKETHSYLGYEMLLNCNLSHKYNVNKLNNNIAYRIKGYPGGSTKFFPVTFISEDYIKEYSDFIPELFSLRFHYAQKFKKDFNTPIEQIKKDLEVVVMDCELKEILQY